MDKVSAISETEIAYLMDYLPIILAKQVRSSVLQSLLNYALKDSILQETSTITASKCTFCCQT